MDFSFTLTSPRAKRLCRCQMTDIMFFVVMLKVVAMAVVALSTLTPLLAQYLDLALALSLAPLQIVI